MFQKGLSQTIGKSNQIVVWWLLSPSLFLVGKGSRVRAATFPQTQITQISEIVPRVLDFFGAAWFTKSGAAAIAFSTSHQIDIFGDVVFAGPALARLYRQAGGYTDHG